jgi:methanethiol S-methyltransferase
MKSTATHDRENNGDPGAVARISLTFAIVHTLMASSQVKELVREAAGKRYRNGLYRAIFVVQSVVIFAWGTWKFLSLPDRELYNAQPPLSWLMRIGQGASIALLVAGVWEADPERMTGLKELRDLLDDKTPDREPPAQGPVLGPDGKIKVTGPYRFTRHPGDLATIGVFWLFPRMTVNHAVLAALATLYSVLGAVHEETRNRAAYGKAFEQYQEEVPFLIPGLPNKEANEAKH